MKKRLSVSFSAVSKTAPKADMFVVLRNVLLVTVHTTGMQKRLDSRQNKKFQIAQVSEIRELGEPICLLE